MHDKHMLRAAIGGIARELAERAFGLARLGEDLAFEHDLGAGGHLELADAAARHSIGCAEQASDDLEFPHLRRIGVDHRAHVVQRMRPDGDGRGQRLPALLGAALELVHPAARMQRRAEPVLALEHHPVKAGRVDTGHGIARGQLSGGDVGAAVDRELSGIGSLVRSISSPSITTSFQRVLDQSARDVLLAAPAEGGRQILRRDTEEAAGGLRLPAHW